MKLPYLVILLGALLGIFFFVQYFSLQQEFGTLNITVSILAVPKTALTTIGIGIFILSGTLLGLGIASYNKTLRN